MKRLSARQRGYDSKWERARADYLRANPLCVMCQADRIVRPATVVDHIVKHEGNAQLFWDRSNWQAICKPHHDRDKQRAERGRQCQSVDADGWPIDATDPGR